MKHSTRSAAVAGALLLLGVAVFVWPNERAELAPATPRPSDEATAGVPAVAVSSPPLATRTETPAPAADAGHPSPQSPALDSFESRIDELVDLGTATWQAAQALDNETAKEHDTEARTRFAALLSNYPLAHERALSQLAGLLTEDESRPGIIRRQVLTTVIRTGVATLWHRHQAGIPRSQIDQFVLTLLQTLPQDETLATELGQQTLVDRPYLGLAHEAEVMQLVEAAAEPDSGYLEPVARGLLRTLWANLESSDSRASSQLASLAMVMLDDTNPSRRAAALEHLVSAENGRFVDIVVQRALESGDSSMLRLVAVTVASTGALEPDRALSILGSLAEATAPGELTSAYMRIGTRTPKSLRRDYEERLGMGATPGIRGELVAGAGFGSKAGVDLARLAFEQDPNSGVRSRALLVLSARAVPEFAERCLLQAIGDESFTAQPINMASIVSGLHNLANQNAPNAVARVAGALMAHRLLSASGRQEVERILRDHLPSGG